MSKNISRPLLDQAAYVRSFFCLSFNSVTARGPAPECRAKRTAHRWPRSAIRDPRRSFPIRDPRAAQPLHDPRPAIPAQTFGSPVQ